MKDFFYYEEYDILAQIAQRSCDWPVCGGVEGQTEQGFERPDVVTDCPCLWWGVWNQMILEGPFPPKPLCNGVSLMGLGPKTLQRSHSPVYMFALRREQICGSL